MKVSVGIPCYNAEKTVAWAVQSVLKQTHKEFVLYLIDDGSKDKTLEIIKSFADDRIQVIADGENRGLAARLNQIIDLCETELLFRMDADDIMFPERLQKQIAYMGKHPECDLLGSQAISIDMQNQVCGLRKMKETISPNDIFSKEVLIHPGLCGRSAWFKENKYDEAYKISEDFELWSRTAGKAVIHNLAEPLLFYREFGSFHYSKYMIQSKLTKQCILKYGPSNLSSLELYQKYGQRLVKDVVYAMLNLFGLWHRSLQKHNSNIDEKNTDLYMKQVKQAVGE